MSGPFTNSRVPLARLGHVADVVLGKMVQPAPAEGCREVPYIKAANVRPDGVRVDELGTMWATEREIATLEVRRGDLFVIEGGATAGRAAVVSGDPSQDAIFQNAVHRVRARAGTHQRFLYYVLTALNASGWYDAICNTSTFKHLTAEKMSLLPVPVHDYDEQGRIVAYLDAEVARIDNLLSLNRELLGLLAARRQAVLSRAVSRGIDPDVETTSTPLPGLNGVPVHWEVVRLKYVVPDITVGIVVTPAQYYAPEGPPCLRGVNVSPGKVSDGDLVRIDHAANEAHHKSMLRAGDVVAVRTGLAGAAAVVPDWAVGGNCVDLLLLRRSPRMLPKFLEHIINSDFARDQIARGSVGTIQSHFNVGALRELVVCVPPLSEQQQIIDHLEGELGRLAELEAEVVEQHRLIEERRQALITAAVTGQIEVMTAGKAA